MQGFFRDIFDYAPRCGVSPLNFESLVRGLESSLETSTGFLVYDTEKEYTVVAQVPGHSSETLKIDVKGYSVSVTGSLPAPKMDGKLVLGSLSSKIDRTILFREKINVDSVDASIKDGMLTIKLTKVGVAPVSPAKKIEIRSV